MGRSSWLWLAPRRPHPTATTAAPCENENEKKRENSVEHADACAARVRRGGHRQSGPHVFAYGRLGSGTVFADRTHNAPAFGIGVRAELESFAVDLSALNFALGVRPGPALNGHHRRVAVQAVGTPLRHARRRPIRLCRRWIELGHRQRWPRSAEWARNRRHELAWRRIAGRADRRLRARPRQRDPHLCAGGRDAAVLPRCVADVLSYGKRSPELDGRRLPICAVGCRVHRRRMASALAPSACAPWPSA